MWYVYILGSVHYPNKKYIGATENLKQRIQEHNSGKSPHTTKYKPWDLLWYSAFPAKENALAFESYLKTHSGRAFTQKRLLQLSSIPA